MLTKKAETKCVLIKNNNYRLVWSEVLVINGGLALMSASILIRSTNYVTANVNSAVNKLRPIRYMYLASLKID